MRIGRHDRIEMNDDIEVVILSKVLLNGVDDLVALEHIGLGGNLGVQACEDAAGAVVMDHEVVHAQNAWIGLGLLFNHMGEFRAGGFAQEWVNGVADKAHAAPQDEAGNREAHPTIEVKAGKLRNHCGHENGACGKDVVAGVYRCGLKRARIDGFANLPVEDTHPAFYGNGKQQNGDKGGTELHRYGIEQLIKAPLCQLDSDKHDDDGNHETCQVLVASVTIGMACVGRFGCKLESQETDDVRSGVGQVVQCVGDD